MQAELVISDLDEEAVKSSNQSKKERSNSFCNEVRNYGKV